MTNVDRETVAGFGYEWSKFDHSDLDEKAIARIFDEYFRSFPWSALPRDPVGADFGCGTGRWARLVGQRCRTLHCVDASAAAAAVARANLESVDACIVHHATIEEAPIEDASLDFAYSLGVLHHIPDTLAALRACTRKLRPGAPFLLYLYYALDNRGPVFRTIWRATDRVRRITSRLPEAQRAVVAELIAAGVYLPLAKTSLLLERMGLEVDQIPLAAYRDKTFYTMRNDALDRFGTPLEQRFTRAEMQAMMLDAGLTNITFQDHAPFWCAVGYKR